MQGYRPKVLQTYIFGVIAINELIYSQQVTPTIFIHRIHFNSKTIIVWNIIHGALHSNNTFQAVCLAFCLKFQRTCQTVPFTYTQCMHA